MDLLTVSRLYHLGGTLVPLRIVVLFLIMLLLAAAHWKAHGRWRLAVNLMRWAAAGSGLLLAGWLALVEVLVFRARCPLCLVASLALVAAFALAGFLKPRGKTVAASMALAATATAYLLPFGTIPKVAVLSAPAPQLDSDSVLRSRGGGSLRVQSFEDFQCPACAQMDRTLERFVDQHGERVQRIYRHFPLTSIHPWAEQAAIVSECAARQGRFEDAKRTLFERQAELAAALAHRPEASWNLPDVAAFRDCVEKRQTVTVVQRDVAEARRLGLRSTPSLLVGQTLVVGAVPLSRLSTILEFAQRQGASATSAESPPVKTLASGCGDDLAGGGCSAP